MFFSLLYIVYKRESVSCADDERMCVMMMMSVKCFQKNIHVSEMYNWVYFIPCIFFMLQQPLLF